MRIDPYPAALLPVDSNPNPKENYEEEKKVIPIRRLWQRIQGKVLC